MKSQFGTSMQNAAIISKLFCCGKAVRERPPSKQRCVFDILSSGLLHWQKCAILNSLARRSCTSKSRLFWSPRPSHAHGNTAGHAWPWKLNMRPTPVSVDTCCWIYSRNDYKSCMTNELWALATQFLASLIAGTLLQCFVTILNVRKRNGACTRVVCKTGVFDWLAAILVRANWGDWDEWNGRRERGREKKTPARTLPPFPNLPQSHTLGPVLQASNPGEILNSYGHIRAYILSEVKLNLQCGKSNLNLVLVAVSWSKSINQKTSKLFIDCFVIHTQSQHQLKMQKL